MVDVIVIVNVIAQSQSNVSFLEIYLIQINVVTQYIHIYIT